MEDRAFGRNPRSMVPLVTEASNPKLPDWQGGTRHALASLLLQKYMALTEVYYLRRAQEALSGE